MASRNPSRPLPSVKNQFRPVSDWLGHISDVDNCPYNSNHVMKSHRLMRHLPKCEEESVAAKPFNKNDGKIRDSLEKCPYNSLHRYPVGEHEEHFRECKSRAAEMIARIEAGESIDDIDNCYLRKNATKTD